jgi:hypothetical protein
LRNAKYAVTLFVLVFEAKSKHSYRNEFIFVSSVQGIIAAITFHIEGLKIIKEFRTLQKIRIFINMKLK